MPPKLLLLTTTSLFAASVATEVFANPYPLVSRRSAEEKICFMHQNGVSLDLTLLCGESLDDVTSGGIAGTVGAGASSRCDSPGQIATDGSRCGNRAASVRSGGRLGGSTPRLGTRRASGFGSGRSGASS